MYWMREAEGLNQVVIYALSWVGIIMLFNFCTWKGNILSFYYDILIKINHWSLKPFGLCLVCTSFWLGILFWTFFVKKDYVVFLGVSQGVIILYTILLEYLFSDKKR